MDRKVLISKNTGCAHFRNGNSGSIEVAKVGDAAFALGKYWVLNCEKALSITKLLDALRYIGLCSIPTTVLPHFSRDLESLALYT